MNLTRCLLDFEMEVLCLKVGFGSPKSHLTLKLRRSISQPPHFDIYAVRLSSFSSNLLATPAMLDTAFSDIRGFWLLSKRITSLSALIVVLFLFRANQKTLLRLWMMGRRDTCSTRSLLAKSGGRVEGAASRRRDGFKGRPQPRRRL